MTDIGNRIKERRIELGMSQDELAEKMGYKSRSTIAKIEKGINDVVQSNVVKFSEILNTSIAYLMGWDEEIEKKSDEQIEASANKLADFFLRIELNEEENLDLMVMLEEYSKLPAPKKEQVREYVHLLAGKD